MNTLGSFLEISTYNSPVEEFLALGEKKIIFVNFYIWNLAFPQLEMEIIDLFVADIFISYYHSCRNPEILFILTTTVKL